MMEVRIIIRVMRIGGSSCFSFNLNIIKCSHYYYILINVFISYSIHCNVICFLFLIKIINIPNQRSKQIHQMSTSRRLSQNKPPKQHCYQDLSCQHCCQCWIKYKKQYGIRSANQNKKYQQACKEIIFLTDINKNLKKELDGCRAKLQLLGDIDQFKEKIRQQLEAEIKGNWAVEEAIMKQKIINLESELKQKDIQIKDIYERNKEQQERIMQLEDQLSEYRSKSEELQEQNTYLKRENEQMSDKLLKMYDELELKSKIIDEKTEAIEKLRWSIQDLQNKYMESRAKASNYGAQNEILSVNLKNRERYIEDLTKCTQENIKNLQNMQQNNRQLKEIVGVLDWEVVAGRNNEQQLKQRLISAEQRLYLTEGFAKYNSQKVELMKKDLQLLKMSI